MSECEYEVLRSALASTRLEGFNVTEQTGKDCVRLMSGEVSVKDLVNEPKADTFNFDHYKVIHYFLFSDLYEWAGQGRTVNISKKEMQFTPPEDIESQAKLIFKRLKERNYFKGLSHDEFVEEIVDFYCVTNALHPFREGTAGHSVFF